MEGSRRLLEEAISKGGTSTRERPNPGKEWGSVDWGGMGRAFGKGATSKEKLWAADWTLKELVHIAFLSSVL